MKKIHYIPHTHWDREWHKTFEGFRVRLNYTMNSLLDLLEKDKEFKFFMFDAQTSVIDDYLDVNPHKRETIKKFVEEGRIFIGPWYTQSDLYWVSGESLVRNLVVGSNLAEDMGGNMEIGYIPDSFGQCSQMPQIMAKAGFKGLFAWRGLSYDETEEGIFEWKAPNGEKILTIQLPIGYGMGLRYLPDDPEEAYKHVKEKTFETERRIKGDNIFILGGTDHAIPQENLVYLINEINQRFQRDGLDYRMEISNLDLYLSKVKEEMLEKGKELEVFQGEARNPKLMRIHAGIGSTRMDIKKINKQLEYRIANITEPMSAILTTLAGEYPNGVINKAWKYLFSNHAHDSICCCCTDEVHKDILSRSRNAKQICDELENMVFRYISQHMDRSKLIGKPVILFNTLPRKRNDYSEIVVCTENKNFAIYDLEGNEIPYKVKEERYFDLATENIGTAMQGKRVWVYETICLIKNDILPASGYTVVQLVENKEGKVKINTALKVIDRTIENDLIKVEINENGTLNVLDKESNTSYEGLLNFQDKGDSGDEYNFSPTIGDKVIFSKDYNAEIECITSNEYMASYKISHKLQVPKALVYEEDRRSDEEETLEIDVELIIYNDSKRIDVKVNINNNSENHIIKALMPVPFDTTHSVAEEHFCTIKRPNDTSVKNWKEQGYNEEPLPIYPMQRFVLLEKDNKGLAVLNRGVTEYEVYDNNTLTINLLRAVSHTGRPDLTIRPGRVSGMEFPTPDAQMIGKFEIEFALLPFEGEDYIQKIYEEGDMYTTKVQSQQVFRESRSNILPLENSLLQIDSKDVYSTTIKREEKGKRVVVRVFNPTKEDKNEVEISFNKSVKTAYEGSILEKNLKELSITEDNKVVIDKIKANEFITVLIEI